MGRSISDASYELVEADGLEANTKRILKPLGLNQLRRFRCPFVRLAAQR